MESKNGIEDALAYLMQLSSEKGFLIFDDIYDAADNWTLSIKDIDYLSSSIVTQGILVQDEEPVIDAVTSAKNNYDDYAQSDYDVIFDRVIELDPELETFITIVRNIVPPQAREMDQLKYQVQEGNSFARERVIQMHLRFAVRIALQRAETYNCEIADTLQEACIGLITAVDKYDPDSDDLFGSYASLWILQNICRRQETQRPTVYYPAHKKEGYYTMYPILKEKGYLDTEEIWTNRKARELIQNKLGCNVDQAEDIIRQSMPIESLDDIYEMFLKNIEENEKRGSVICGRSTDIFCWYDDYYDKIEKESLREILEELMEGLKPREREIIRARYGFDDGVEKTLEEVGHMMGVSRERIRQIESNVMKKMRQPVSMKKIKDFLQVVHTIDFYR